MFDIWNNLRRGNIMSFPNINSTPIIVYGLWDDLPYWNHTKYKYSVLHAQVLYKCDRVVEWSFFLNVIILCYHFVLTSENTQERKIYLFYAFILLFFYFSNYFKLERKQQESSWYMKLFVDEDWQDKWNMLLNNLFRSFKQLQEILNYTSYQK